MNVAPASAARALPSAEGLLESRPIEQLLAYAEDRGLAGTLVLSGEGEEIAAITFREGKVVRVRTRAAMPLGTVLYELGFLDAEGVNTALAALAKASSRTPKVLFGDILRERAMVSPDLVAIGVGEQLTRKLASLFHLPGSTRFGFYDRVDLIPEYGRDDVPVSVGRAVLRGLREVFLPARAREALDRVGDRPIVLAGYVQGASGFGLFEALADLELSDAETRVAQLLTEPKPLSVFELARVSAVDARIVYALLLLRRARVATVTPESEALRRASMQFRAPSPLRPPSVEIPISGVQKRAEPYDPRREPPMSEPRIMNAHKAPSSTPEPGAKSASVPTSTSAPPPSSGEAAKDPVLARLKARGLVRRAELTAALPLLRELREQHPKNDDAELETLYGYCLGLTQSDFPQREEARSALMRGVNLAPRSGEALYRLSLFERHEGRLADALRHMKEAALVDPNHIDAVRELRLFNMRVQSGMQAARAMSPPGGIPAVKDPRKE